MNDIDVEKAWAILAIFDNPDSPVGRSIGIVRQNQAALKARLALAEDVIKAARPHTDWERGVFYQECEELRHSIADYDKAYPEQK